MSWENVFLLDKPVFMKIIRSVALQDEGRSGDGPDTRSSSSSSSHSSMKMIGDKLRSQGKARWALLALVIAISIVVIIGVTVAVYFVRNSGAGGFKIILCIMYTDVFI